MISKEEMEKQHEQQINNFTWFCFKKGNYKANYKKLKESCLMLIKMADQNTAGQRRKYNRGDIDWSLLNPTIMAIVLEACALVVSGDYDEWLRYSQTK